MSVPKVFKDVVRPSGTRWIKAQLRITYSCEDPPAKPTIQVTGVNYLGFVFMSGYEVDAHIDGGTLELCEMDGCTNSMKYRFQVRLESYLVLGIGFTSDVAEGTFSWKSSPVEQVIEYVTPCFCCDDLLKPKPLVASAQTTQHQAASGLSAALAIGAAVAIPAAIVVSLGDPYLAYPWAIALWALGVAQLLSLMVALARRAFRIRNAAVRDRSEFDA